MMLGGDTTQVGPICGQFHCTPACTGAQERGLIIDDL
jgi:hypothetical protein